MSVLIKNMEMPTRCYVCPFCDYVSARCDAVSGTPYTPESRYEQRAEFCPLVPATDVAEVWHGHWKPWKYKGMGLLPISGYQCSQCGVLTDGIEDTPTAYQTHYRPNYCPNCGAKMDMSEEDDNG